MPCPSMRRCDQEATRLEALRWVHFLLLKAQTQVRWGEGLGPCHVGVQTLHGFLDERAEGCCWIAMERQQGLRHSAGFASCCCEP